MMILFSVRMPDGSELGGIYALHRGSAEAFTADELSDQYGDDLLLVEVQRMTMREARDDLSFRKTDGLELWWSGLGSIDRSNRTLNVLHKGLHPTGLKFGTSAS